MRDGRVSIASYNVHECVGLDGRRDPGRIAEVLKALDCDVIGLQEVHPIADRQPEARQLFYLAEKTGLEPIAGHTLFRQAGDFGNALLTRLPVLEVRRHDLSLTGREPRGALEAALELPSGILRIVTTHLGLRPAERRKQVALLLTRIEARAGEMLVLLGDINEWLPWARSLRWIDRTFGATPALSSFPSHRPMVALDRVWVRPREALLAVTIHRSELSRVASDHLPIRAEIRADIGLHTARGT